MTWDKYNEPNETTCRTRRKMSTNKNKYFAIFFSQLFMKAACARQALVNLDYLIEPTNNRSEESTALNCINSTRDYFPPEDIVVQSIKFKGVFVDGVELSSYNLILDTEFVFHDAYLKQVSMSQVYGDRGIVVGSVKNYKSYKPIGIRLRGADQILSCLNAENFSPVSIVVTLLWEVEYEFFISQLHQRPDSVLVASWFHNTKSSSINQLSSRPFEFVSYIEFMKDVYLLGVIVHSHPWLNRVQFKYRDNDILLHKHASQEDENIDSFTAPQFISAGDRLYFKFFGESNQHTVHLSLSISAFVACSDGSSEISQKNDLYTTPCEGFFECITCAKTKKLMQCAPSINGNNDPFGVYKAIQNLSESQPLTGALVL